MLSIEQEPLKLPKIETETDTTEGKRVRYYRPHDDGLCEFIVPRRFLFLWSQVRIGASLYDLSLRLRSQAKGSRVFLEVSSFLSFLVDQDIVTDIRFVRLVDSIRGEYQWHSSLLQVLSMKSRISEWSQSASHLGERRTPLSRIFDLLAVGTTLLLFFLVLITSAQNISLIRMHRWTDELLQFGTITFSPVLFYLITFFTGFLVAGTIGRTLGGFVRAGLSRIAGDSGRIYFQYDLAGPFLEFQPVNVTGGFRRSTDFITIFFPLVSVLFLIVIGRWNSQLYNSFEGVLGSLLFLSGTLFLTAMTTHPMIESALTSSLKVWNRNPLAWRESDELMEIAAFHQLGFGLSALLGFCSIVIILVVSIQQRPLWKGSFFLVELSLIIFIAFVYLEPYLGAGLAAIFPNSHRAHFNLRRRMWDSRKRVLETASVDRESWQNLPVVRQLTAPIRQKLLSVARVVEYFPGKAVCRQGDTSRSLYIVLEGRFAVAKRYTNRRRKVVAILTKGSAFGETAFFFGAERTADVVAIEKSRVLEIPYREDMQNLDLSKSDEFQFRVWLLQALSGNEMLKELPSEAMDTLIFAGKRKTFRAGEVIFTEGSPGDVCYFIAQGQVSIIQEAKKVKELGAGDTIGEIALLRPGMRRTATVTADSDLLCMELNSDDFWALMAARLPLGAEIERLALRRLKEDEARRIRIRG